MANNGSGGIEHDSDCWLVSQLIESLSEFLRPYSVYKWLTGVSLVQVQILAVTAATSYY